MEKPQRIQQKRTKGWKMPENTVYVGRPTKWGNPFKPDEIGREEAVARYRAYIADSPLAEEAKRELRGKHLSCWCSLDGPCHADILIEIANAPDS
jgi:hypothetical protein